MAESVEKCHLDNGHISYSPSDMIGRGGFGVVYCGFMDVKNFEEQSVAIKKINLSCYTEKARDKEPMVNLHHENFVKIIKVLMDDEFRYLVMEMCIGTLAQVIDRSFKGPNLPSDNLVLRDIASGLHYIHTAKLVHRNIKPENILISKDARMKLSDLSFAESITYGNCCWMAQELLEMLMIIRAFGADNSKDVKLKVTTSCDIFSTGCVFFVFLTRGSGGIHPFGDECIEQIGNIRKNLPVNIDRLDFNHFGRSAINKMIAHNPCDRAKLPDVLKMLETNEIQKTKDRLRKNLFSTDSARSLARDSDALLVMNEERHLLENVKANVPLETTEKSIVDTLVDNTDGNNNCCRDEIFNTSNLNRKDANEEQSELDSSIPPIAADEALECFKQSSFPSIEARKVFFHPILPELLCCETVNCDVLLLKMADSSFSHVSYLVKDMENLKGKKTFSVSWNVDGTLLAASYKHGRIAIWEFPSVNIMFCEDYSFTEPRIEWNPFCSNRLSIYQWMQKSVVLVDIKLCINLEIIFPKGIIRLVWILVNKFVAAYSNGSMYIHLISENCGVYSVTNFMKFDNTENKVLKCLKWNQKHKLLASGSCGGFINFWSVEESKPICTYSTVNGTSCNTLDWLSDATTQKQSQTSDVMQDQLLPFIACGLANGTIVILNPLRSGVVVRKILSEHTGDVHRIAFSPNGQFLISIAKKVEGTYVSTSRNELRIWSTKTWTPQISTFYKHVMLDWNASSKTLAVACATTESISENPPTRKLDIFNVVEQLF